MPAVPVPAVPVSAEFVPTVSVPAESMAVEVVPASPDRFAAVQEVLGGGQGGACWCMYFRMSASEYGRVSREELPEQAARREARLRVRGDAPPAPGMLAFAGGHPVGWCGLGRHGEFERLVRSRTIPAPDDPATWAIVCFLVRPGHRRRGVAAALLDGAVRYALDCGAPAIEGYPVDAAGARLHAASAYMGSVDMYAEAGFERIAPTRARSEGLVRWVMRRRLRAPDAPTRG